MAAQARLTAVRLAAVRPAAARSQPSFVSRRILHSTAAAQQQTLEAQLRSQVDELKAERDTLLASQTAKDENAGHGNLDHLKAEGDINLSPRRTAYAERNIDAETQAVLDEDSAHFLHQSLSSPCLNVLERAEGVHITDRQGRSYLDFHGNSVHQVGFSNPAVLGAIKNQLDVLPFCTRRYTNQVAIDLAKRLTELAPDPLSRVLFCPGGTGAIGMALKLARYATGRHKTISMWDSFHGASLDAISIGGEQIFRADCGPLMSGTSHAPPPDDYRASESGFPDAMASARYIEYILEKEGDISAVIAEPVRKHALLFWSYF